MCLERREGGEVVSVNLYKYSLKEQSNFGVFFGLVQTDMDILTNIALIF